MQHQGNDEKGKKRREAKLHDKLKYP